MNTEHDELLAHCDDVRHTLVCYRNEIIIQGGRPNDLAEVDALIVRHNKAIAARLPDAQPVAQEPVIVMEDSGDAMNTPKPHWISAGYRSPIGTYLYESPQPAPQQPVAQVAVWIADDELARIQNGSNGWAFLDSRFIEHTWRQVPLYASPQPAVPEAMDLLEDAYDKLIDVAIRDAWAQSWCERAEHLFAASPKEPTP